MIRPSAISLSDLTLRQDGHGKGPAPLLEKNQVIDAKVKKIISSSRAELIIAGKTMLADTSLLTDDSRLLTRGEIITLEITGDGKVKVMRPAPSLLTSSNEASRATAPIMDLLSNNGAGLIKIFEPFFSNGNGENSFKDTSFYNVKNFTGYGSKKITGEDIKAHVLEFISKPESKSDNPVHHLKDFSEVVGKFQVLNSHFSESGIYLIPFPVFLNGNLQIGQFLFDLGDKKNDKKKKNKRVINVSLLLNMSNLGALRVDLSVLKKDISGMIQVSDEETRVFIKKMIPELKRGLNRHDFRVMRMDCAVVRAERLESTVFLDDVLHNGINELNIII